MKNKTENRLRIYWDKELTIEEKQFILSKHHFWDGLSNYLYHYIPEDLKQVLLLKLKEKDPLND